MTIIFVHGLGQSSSSWENTLNYMTLSKSKLYHPDLYSLLSDKEYTYENLYNSFSDYCNNTPGKIDLCGLSLGAILSLNYTINYPEKVKSLVLIGAQYKTPKRILKLQNIFFRILPEKIFENMKIKKRDILKLTNSMLELDFSNSLDKISCETLILCGEKDYANKKAAFELKNHISNSKLKLIKKAGHEINLEYPKELAIILNEFWN